MVVDAALLGADTKPTDKAATTNSNSPAFAIGFTRAVSRTTGPLNRTHRSNAFEAPQKENCEEDKASSQHHIGTEYLCTDSTTVRFRRLSRLACGLVVVHAAARHAGSFLLWLVDDDSLGGQEQRSD